MPQSLRILHPQWRREYEATPYPFGDWATLTNADGVFIPEGTFLDAAFYPIGSGPRLRLSKATVGDQLITLYLGDDTNTELCSGQLDMLAPRDEIRFSDSYGRPAGVAISTAERLLIFQTWPPGTHEFTFEETGFAAHVCLPVPNTAFRGFLLADGSVVAGDIWLIGDDGIALSVADFEKPQDECDVQLGLDPNEKRIRIDVVGDPLFRQRLCANVNTSPRFLQTVTFVRGATRTVVTPDAFGSIKLTAGRLEAESTILRIRNIDGTLKIETVGEALTDLPG